jgi:hypothetical protein
MTDAARLETANAETSKAVALVVQWVDGAAQALKNEKLTATERARLGELALSAATWLSEREAGLTKEARQAAWTALKKAVAHLPPAEQMQRLKQGY